MTHLRILLLILFIIPQNENTIKKTEKIEIKKEKRTFMKGYYKKRYLRI